MVLTIQLGFDDDDDDNPAGSRFFTGPFAILAVGTQRHGPLGRLQQRKNEFVDHATNDDSQNRRWSEASRAADLDDDTYLARPCVRCF